MTQAVTLVFFPVFRCMKRHCRAAFVASFNGGPFCAKCEAVRVRDAEIHAGKLASRRDIIQHKRLSLRKRLGLLAQEPSA